MLFLACAALSALEAGKTVTDKDNGTAVHLKTGEMLEVRLGSNPSTGFAWYIMKGSTTLLKLTSQSQAGPPNNGMVGQPVVQIFNFKAVDKGSDDLMLHYVRSWEAPKPDDKQFILHVTVE
jgi:inhibitor of cysteine peptidase